ncbi:MAG: sensor histidine kinase [Chloroflexota bacterium]
MIRRQRAYRLTLRTRLTFWTAAMLVACTLTVTALINVGTTLTSHAAAPVEQHGGLRIGVLLDPRHPGTTTVTVTRPVEGIDVLRQMRLTSLVGLTFVLLVGIAGAYWLVGYTLRPLRDVSQAARAIDRLSADNRLPYDGPNDEVSDLNEALNAMLGRLQDSFERERRFVADASHELRTPLAVMRTNIEVLAADDTATIDDYRSMAATVDRSLRRLEGLVTDLLLLARQGDAHAFVTEKVGVRPLLDGVIRELEPLARQSGVTVSYVRSDDALVLGAESHLRRALRNVVENGIRYNVPGGQVTITSGLEGGWVTVGVIDTGVGIPPDEQGQVFNRFWRADRSRTRAGGGAGLGLALASEVVRIHGGAITVRSEEGKGSTFTVRLPVLNDPNPSKT